MEDKFDIQAKRQFVLDLEARIVSLKNQNLHYEHENEWLKLKMEGVESINPEGLERARRKLTKIYYFDEYKEFGDKYIFHNKMKDEMEEIIKAYLGIGGDAKPEYCAGCGNVFKSLQIAYCDGEKTYCLTCADELKLHDDSRIWRDAEPEKQIDPEGLERADAMVQKLFHKTHTTKRCRAVQTREKTQKIIKAYLGTGGSHESR